MTSPAIFGATRVIGAPISPASVRQENWNNLLSRANRPPGLIRPEESAANPVLACLLRATVLQRTYGGEYHTDTQDTSRLAEAVRQGIERISFWGDPKAINQVKEWLSSGNCPSPESLRSMDIGTASVLDMSSIYGTGYGELSRTGSMCRDYSAESAILGDLSQILFGETGHFRTQHTFVALPRNRRSSADVRGGAAIHRMHVRSIGSAFWGIAPWYVMQGGLIEALDYREIYRDPELVIALNTAIRDVWVDSAGSEAFVRDLLTLNFGEEVLTSIRTRIAGKHTPHSSGWDVCPSAPRDLIPFCPAIIRPSSGQGMRLEEVVDQASNAAAIAVYVPLEEAEYASVQHWLADHDFHLTIVIPSKPLNNTRTSLIGVWSRTRAGLSWWHPYYLCHTTDGIQAKLLRSISQLCNMHNPV